MQSWCILVTAVTIEKNVTQVGPGSKCLACDREAYKEMTKLNIKDEILKKLGFASAPNVTGTIFLDVPWVKKQIEEVSAVVNISYDFLVS